MFKWLGRLFLLGVLAVIILAVFAYFNLKASQPPDIENAPYALQAYYQDDEGKRWPTRVYYAEKIELVDGYAIISNYWSYDGERYYKHNEDKKVSPPYSVVRRLR